MTRTPASGSFELVTTPAISSASTAIRAPTRDDAFALGSASTRTIGMPTKVPSAAKAIPIRLNEIVRIPAFPPLRVKTWGCAMA